MKVKSNFMGNDTKIKANTIAMVDNNKGIPLDEYLGNLSNLNTSNKSSLVNAINSLFPNNVIVESGSNSNGTWRKYANGDMECWFIQQVSVAIMLSGVVCTLEQLLCIIFHKHLQKFQ